MIFLLLTIIAPKENQTEIFDRRRLSHPKSLIFTFCCRYLRLLIYFYVEKSANLRRANPLKKTAYNTKMKALFPKIEFCELYFCLIIGEHLLEAER